MNTYTLSCVRLDCLPLTASNRSLTTTPATSGSPAASGYTYTPSPSGSASPAPSAVVDYLVSNVHWQVHADDGQGHTSDQYGSQLLPAPMAGQPITPYSQLTLEQVIAWTEAAIGVARMNAYKASLDQRIQNEIAPPVVAPNLPWATTTSAAVVTAQGGTPLTSSFTPSASA